MDELENAVDMMMGSADDAQESNEISLDDLMDNLTGASETEEETAEQTGDSAPETQEQKPDGDKDKFSRRIASALANQRKGFQKELDFSAKVRGVSGDMTEDEIAEALRSYQASKIAKGDADISEKAARKIVEEREKAAAGQAGNREAEITSGLNSLIDDGWTMEELRAFSGDEQVKQDVNSGMSIRKAAKAYLQREAAPKETTPVKRRSVPTAKTAGTGNVPEENRIENMTDAEFARFSDRAQEMMMEGKRVRF